MESEDFLNPYEEFDYVTKSKKSYIVLIIYNIADNKRRSKMVKCLESYGIRVQKSAFEAYIDKKQYDELSRRASRIIDIETDSLRIYMLNSNTSVRSWGSGDMHIDDVIVF